MLMFAIGGCIVATVAFLFSGVWSWDNFKNFFYSQVDSQLGIPGWVDRYGAFDHAVFRF